MVIDGYLKTSECDSQMSEDEMSNESLVAVCVKLYIIDFEAYQMWLQPGDCSATCE